MNNLRYLAFSFFSFVFLFVGVSCKEDDEGANEKNQPSAKVSVSPSSFEFPKDAHSTELYVTAKEEPSVSVSADWCRVELVSNEELNYSYKVSVSANEEYKTRSCELSVSVGSSFSQVVPVTQAPSPLLRLVSGVPMIDALEDSGDYLFSMEANAVPIISCAEKWVSVSEPVVDGDVYKYTVSISQNYFARKRTASVSFSVDELVVSIAVSQEASSNPVQEVKAVEIVKLISTGINIGNTLEAIGGETAWGQPQVNEKYIAGLKAAGFNAVRIPCSWSQYLEKGDVYGENTIKADWMARVTEVVDMIVKNDMYAVLNAHWDGGWLEDNIGASVNAVINQKQHDIWEQIALNFRNYDSHLLFAGMNEPNQKGTQTSDVVNTMRTYQQTFVDAVRATGGNNVVRILVVQGPGTSIDKSTEFYTTLPEDPSGEGYMMMEVHYYDPYQFTIMENDESWGKVFLFWGKDNLVAESDRNTGDYGNESYLKFQMQKMYTNYVTKGYPVIIGEYAAAIKKKYKFNMTDDEYAKHKASVAYFDGCVAKYAKQFGCVGFLWECGETINRGDGSVKEKDVVDAIIKGAASVEYPF